MATYLIALQNLNPLTVFTTEEAAKTIIEKIKEEARKIDPDISTESGREQIRAMAYKIAKSKTAIDKMGKDLTDEWAKKKKAVDAGRRLFWDELEALQAEVRKPLTDWENAEKERVAAHERELIVLANLSNLGDAGTSSQAEENLVSLDGAYKSRNWEEFKARADDIYTETRGSLIAAAHNLKKQEEERAELERLRREEAARKAEEERKRIAEEAAAKAKADAEAKAAEDARIAKEKADREKAELERKAQEEEARAQKAEEARIAAEAKAKADAEAAEKRRLADIEQARKEEEARQQKIRDDEAAAIAKREADNKHKAEIHNSIMAALIDVLDVSQPADEAAKNIIIAIAKGKIPHVKILY